MNASPKDRRTRCTLDVIIELTTRLALAITKLREIADACAECGGTGETGEMYEIRTMTDDPRLIGGERAKHRRARIALCGSAVSNFVIGAAVLTTPCPACADLRATIRTCEGPTK